ncbi:MAG: hypothetical protein WAK84_09055 [Candidatus Cybelea sp.]
MATHRATSIACAAVVAALMLWMAATAATCAQTTEPSPSPSSAAPSAAGENTNADTGGFDPSKLTPAQQEALRLAIIKTSQNPVGNISIVPFQNNFNYGVGPYTRLQYNLNVQPVFPIMLSSKMNLITRTIVPVLNQPSPESPAVCASPGGCPSTFGLSDVQEQLFFAPKTKPGELIWAVGPIFQFPTATPNTLGSGKWSAGPDAVALVMPGSWVLGALVTQLWSFAGLPDRPSVNSFLVQPFVNYNLKGGWAVTSAPIMTSNASLPGTKWTVPLGGGVSKTFKDDGQLMQLALLYYTNVVRPLAAPQTTLRISWSLLWPVKRGIDVQQLLQEAK